MCEKNHTSITQADVAKAASSMMARKRILWNYFDKVNSGELTIDAATNYLEMIWTLSLHRREFDLKAEALNISLDNTIKTIDDARK